MNSLQVDGQFLVLDFSSYVYEKFSKSQKWCWLNSRQGGKCRAISGSSLHLVCRKALLHQWIVSATRLPESAAPSVGPQRLVSRGYPDR